MDDGGPLRAEQGTELVEGAAFESVAGHDQFARDLLRTAPDPDIFERKSFHGAHGGRPGGFPAAVGGLEGFDADAVGREAGGPGSIRSGLRPGGPAEGEDHPVGGEG